MSTRWYPLFKPGGPQLRVFLPNFWLKLVRPSHEQPENTVQFACSMEMTKYDVKNYLEKIYNIPVVEVRTRIAMGRTKRDLKVGYVTKEDDTKYAYVTMVIPLMLYIYFFQNHYYTTFPERLAQGAQIHFPRYIPGRSQATTGRRRQSA